MSLEEHNREEMPYLCCSKSEEESHVRINVPTAQDEFLKLFII